MIRSAFNSTLGLVAGDIRKPKLHSIGAHLARGPDILHPSEIL